MSEQGKSRISIFPPGIEHVPHQRYDRLLQHPGYPDVIIKDCGGTGDSKSYMVEIAAKARSYSRMLSHKYHIPTAEVEFVIGPDSKSSRDDRIFAIARYIKGVSLPEALHNPANHDDVREETTMLVYRLLDHLNDVIEKGGDIEPEMLRYDQYMYDPSAPKGKRAVLVDIEPGAPSVVIPPENRHGLSDVEPLLDVSVYLANVIIALEKNQTDFHLREALFETMGKITIDDTETRKIKQLILGAVTYGNEGIVDDYLDIYFNDENDDWA